VRKLAIVRRHRSAPIARSITAMVAIFAAVVAVRAFPELRRYIRMRSM
jgi:hypothetical protein